VLDGTNNKATQTLINHPALIRIPFKLPITAYIEYYNLLDQLKKKSHHTSTSD